MKILNKRVRLLPEDSVYSGMFDFAKGIFILGMFILHAAGNYYTYWETPQNIGFFGEIAYLLFKLATTSQIPMMFMICGYGWRRKSMAKALKTQVSSLLMPYLLVAAVVAVLLVVKKLVMGGELLEELEYNALSFLFGYPPGNVPFLGLKLGFIGPMWFIVCYFFSAIWLNAILWIGEGWLRWTAALLMACAGILLKDTNTVWFLQQSLICTAYMYVGWEIKKQNFLKKDAPLALLLAAVGMAVWMTYVGYIDVAQHIWKNGMLDAVDGLLIGVLLMLLLLRLNVSQGKLSNALRWLGRRILPICCAHSVMYVILRSGILVDHFQNARALGTLVETLIHFGFSVVAAVLIEAIRKKISLRRKKAAE